MRPSNKSRSRNKPGNNGGNHNNQRRSSMGNIINRVFESAGPDGKVRGTPQQIIDKYQALARDAQVAGDRVAAESYLQHSEHYSRLLGEAQRQQMENRSFQQEREDGQRGEDGFDQPHQPQPQAQQPQPQRRPQPVASGLTTIDTDDAFDTGGPIDTPEGRRTGYEPAPIVEPVTLAEPMPAPAAGNGRQRAEAAAPPEPQPQPEPQPEPEAVPQPEAAPELAAAEAAPAPKKPRRRRTTAPAPTPEEPASAS